MTFCGLHRYPENHGCEFDFKGRGREQIAKSNPMVKAEKAPKLHQVNSNKGVALQGKEKDWKESFRLFFSQSLIVALM